MASPNRVVPPKMTFKQLSGITSEHSRAKTLAGLGIVLAVLGSFAACHALGDDSDSANAASSSTLPDWTNDLTKAHRK